MAPERLTGVLLVGGASTRFGSPKALAWFEGETLAERAWRTLAEVTQDRIAVGKRGELDLPLDVIDDKSTLRAPMVGIVAGLRKTRTVTALVVPVDMPFVRADDLRALADACIEAAVPQTGPLPCALCREAALPVFERRIETGELSLRDAFTELRTAVVELDPTHLANVNTAAELERCQLAIVPLRVEHAAEFRALVTETHREFGFDFDARLDGDLDDPLAHYAAAWVAVRDGIVVGSVALRRIAAREVELKRMYLRPSERGRGIGQRLLDTAVLWAHEHRVERIVLDTTQQMTAARALYERNGFVRFDGAAHRQGRELLLYERRL